MEGVETLFGQEMNAAFIATTSTLVHAAEDLDEGLSDKTRA